MQKSFLKTGGFSISTVIDQETGEVLESNVKKHTYIANSKEEFMLLYVNVLPIFIDLSGPAKTVYAYLLNNYNTSSIFEIGKNSRGMIAHQTGYGLSTIANSFTELKEKKLVYQHQQGMYQINPRYAFKGSSVDRNQALKVLIELGCKDC